MGGGPISRTGAIALRRSIVDGAILAALAAVRAVAEVTEVHDYHPPNTPT
jgi:hypothetical protein